MKILVIDDEQIICNLIQDVLNDEGHTVEVAATGKEGIELAKKEDYELIFLDIRLPDVNGITVLNQIKEARPGVKFIIITAYPSLSTSQAALRAGAFDYIIKPFSIEDIVHCAKRAIEFKELSQVNERLLKQLQEQNIALESKIKDRTEDLKQMYEQRQADYLNTLKSLCEAVEAKDSYTNSHSKKVALYSILIADEMRLPSEEKEILLEACQLHDLGKIGIPDEILKKPDKLSNEEFEVVKTHPMKAVSILTPLTFLRRGVIEIIRQHHERYDGKGYPEGLRAEQIHIGARILMVADTFDALYSLRPYRQRPMTKDEVIKVITENSGLQFDPKVVEAFLKVVGRF